MKKRIVLIIVLLIVLIGAFTLNFIFSSPIMFSNSNILDPETNYEIKKVVLGSVKDYCSSLSANDQDNIYDVSSRDSIIHFDKDAERNKELVYFIDHGFMRTLERIGKDEYRVTVTHYELDFTYYYHIAIKKIDGEYKITSFAVDI